MIYIKCVLDVLCPTGLVLPFFIRHYTLARAVFAWQGTCWEHFLEQENLWQVAIVTAETDYVFDSYPSKSCLLAVVHADLFGLAIHLQ